MSSILPATPMSSILPTTPRSFHPFSRLPPELQTQVWEACIAGSRMHVLDVCYPSRTTTSIPETPPLHQDTVFLDLDASTHRHLSSLRRTHPLAAWAVQAKEARSGSTVVCLPARGAKLTLPSSDVLMLRFRDGPSPGSGSGSGLGSEDPPASLIGPVLRSQWSASLASTLHTARNIALDVVEGNVFSAQDALGWDDMTHLASTLYRDLEVLYLVDAGAAVDAQRLRRRGELWTRLDRDGKPGDHQRPADVVRGIGKTYVEVFDLEALGWSACHPAYGFAFLMGNAIRLHQSQGEKCVFQGVRVLVVKDE